MTSSDSENENEGSAAWSRLETNSNFDLKSNKKLIIPRRSSSGTDEIDTGRQRLSDALTPSTPYSLLVQSLVKQLCSFIEKDKTRSNELYNKMCKKLHELHFIDESYERTEFENIRSSYELALNALVELAKENSLPIKDIDVWPLSSEPNRALEWSRYYRDFEEIEKIAQGGFGDVFKARHKLDNNIYAIKKILIKSTRVRNVLSHLREVKTFASLNNINIVPFKSCWIEPLICYQQENRIVNDESWSTQSDAYSEHIRMTKSQNDSLRLQQTNDSFSINFEYSENHQSEKSFASTISNESISRMESLRKLEVSRESGLAVVPHVKLAWSTLFIQMKLCQKTLRNFLDERNESENFLDYYKTFNLCGNDQTYTALSIFYQICNGLEYIHNRSIVHHDLKPGNVFLSFDHPDSTVLFQLGDFGLACPLENNEFVQSHDGFGTRLYAPAEQLEGRICTKKSDIYSLGIILIEILLKCTTMMECFKKVEKVKKGEMLPEIDLNICQLISKLLTNKYELRPDISELKQKISRYVDNSSEEVIRLKKIIDDKDKHIDDLMEEIKKLKSQLSQE